ncbi:MFS transporter [Streptomyces orinoci]|uniref:MFS transporter n=1 Tax=Streptomyces orinoci TaxID=67339 RepID=A0ABV3K0K8_STRON|nr:MFS transporter [Streptomyces orinoci]
MRKWLPLTAVCLGTFMLLVDVTIVVVALPDMAGSLHTSFADLQWVMDIYALALAALLLGLGSLADRIGHRQVYMGGVALFALASLACGLATDPAVLIAFRGVQGVGGAAMLATTTALVARLYQGRDRGVAFGAWGAVSGAASAAGPILGGLLTEYLDWRWIFFVNLPISVLAIAMTARFVPAHGGGAHGGAAGGARGRGIDLPGMVTFTVAAGALTYALIKGADYGWSSGRTLGLFGLAVLALLVFLVLEPRRAQPMLDLALFRRGSFTGLMIVAVLLSVAAFSYLAYTSLWLQSVRGMGPVTAGLACLPMSGASFVFASLGGRYLQGISPRVSLGVGMLLIGGGALLMTVIGAGSTWTVLVAGFLATGVGVGLSMPVLASTAMAAVPPERAGMASGAVNTARQLGNALGIAVLGVVFHAGVAGSLRDHGSALPADALAGGQAGPLIAHAAPERRGVVREMVHIAFADGLRDVFWVSGALGVLGGVVALLLVRRSSAPAQGAPRQGREAASNGGSAAGRDQPQTARA